ncbi:MAG: 4Fe-4S dicluster domain-containing protein [Candidatus Hodarchaeota archaeon]
MINNSTSVNFDDLDPEFAQQVMEEMGEDILACFNCGCCTGGCPIVPWEMNMRKLIQMVILGFTDDVLKSKIIWFCTECKVCGERCPQKVKPFEIIIALRHFAIEKGIIPLIYRVMALNLEKSGRVAEISEAVELRRERLNIPKAGLTLPEKVIKEIKTILKETSFDRKLKEKDYKKEE